MHLTVCVKTEKNPKNPLVWPKKKTKKKHKKTQKTPKNQQKTQKPTGLVFFFKNPGFFQPCIPVHLTGYVTLPYTTSELPFFLSVRVVDLSAW